MKGVTKFFFALQILAAVLLINSAYAENPVSGTIRYSDNLEPVIRDSPSL